MDKIDKLGEWIVEKLGYRGIAVAAGFFLITLIAAIAGNLACLG